VYDPFLYTLPLGMDQYFGAAESPYGIIKAQLMTYTESKRGKSTTTGIVVRAPPKLKFPTDQES